MKKYFCLIGLLSLITTFSFSQNPYNGIPYQAVMRNSNGVAIADSTINLLFQLRSGSTQGTLIYEETQTISTNGHGLMSAYIGNGQASLGTFENIDWKSYPLFLKVLMNGAEMGSQELKSVPYAIQSKYAEKVRVDLSPNGDTLLVGDTLIAVSQFNAGLNGTGELINDQSGMVQTTTLNLNCVVDELPFLRIKACDMDTAENMYFLLEYLGEHDFYGMHLSCNATMAYKLCKVSVNGNVVWIKNISLGESGLSIANLAVSQTGKVLLSACSEGTSDGISAYPFTIQLQEATLNYSNRAQFLILFDENGNYLDHENIPGNYLIKFFSSNNQGYAAINENADATTTAIVAMRMYQYSGNTIDLLWSNTTASWGNIVNLEIDNILPKLHCIFSSGTSFNFNYKEIQNSTVTQIGVVFKASTTPLNCDFYRQNNDIILNISNFIPMSITPMTGAAITGNFFTVKFNINTGIYSVIDFNSLGNSSIVNSNQSKIKNQLSQPWFIESYYTSTANSGGIPIFSGLTQLTHINSISGVVSKYPLNKFYYRLFTFRPFNITRLISLNSKLYIFGNYDSNQYPLNFSDLTFPIIPGVEQYPFILTVQLE